MNFQKTFGTLLITVLITLLSFSVNTSARTYYVNGQAGQDDWSGKQQTHQESLNGPKATIGAALALTHNGDVISLAAGTYQGEGNVNLVITGKGIRIISEEGLGSVIIDCDSSQGFTIKECDSEVSLAGLWIINGSGPRGGAVVCDQSEVRISDCMFANHKMASGGAIYLHASRVKMDRCGILGNTSAYSGGGIDCWDSELRISNSLISGNRAERHGGGISAAMNSVIKIVNCTINQNFAGLNGGGLMVRHGSEVSATQTIFWANETSGRGAEISLVNRARRPSRLQVTYCDIAEGQDGIHVEKDCDVNWGKGNISKDPLFSESGHWDNNGTRDLAEDDFWLSGDLHLGEGSPCINAGSSDFLVGPNDRDFDVQPRRVNGWVDLGAYETQLEADWIVDDNGYYDPGPGDSLVSDPLEDGSNIRPFDAIQEAIDMASDGETILIRDGVYQGEGNYNLKISGKALTVRSENGAKQTTIDCERLGQGFILDQVVQGDVVLDGLTITGGWAIRGGAVFSRNSNAVITHCVIRGNEALSSGGGIYCEGDLGHETFPVISHNQITGNKANGPGGGIEIYYFNITPHIVHNLIAGNQSQLRGGGISIFTINTPAYIINNTITSNRGPQGGGMSLYATSGTELRNCILWDNQASEGLDLHVQQFGKLLSSDVDIDYCNFSGDELAIPVSLESNVNWGENNLIQDPGFVAPGHFNENGTKDFPHDDIWVDGDYHLNYLSTAINAGQNEALVSYSGAVFHEVIDLGAFEYRGIDPNQHGQPSEIVFKKVLVKAGKKENSDQFQITGRLGEIPENLEDIGDLTIRVGHYVETIYADQIKWNRQGDKLHYTNRHSGIKSAKIDLNHQMFSFSAQKIDLTGLKAPIIVEIALGNYYGFGVADEKIINGKKSVPIAFMSGFSNSLRVNKLRDRKIKLHSGLQSTQWTITGEIALADSDIDLSAYSLEVRWANLEETLAPKQMVRKGSSNVYQYKLAKYSELALAKAKFDLSKYRFTVVLDGDIEATDLGEFQLILRKDNEIAFDETIMLELN